MIDKTNKLKKEQIESFFDDGFLFPIKVLSKKETNEIATSILNYHLSDEAQSNQNLSNEIYRFKTYLIFEWADYLVHNKKVLDLAESIIGSNILIWSVGMFIKPPASNMYVTWHQDATYYGLNKLNQVINIWISITDSTLENGYMSYLPKSHKLGQIDHVDTWDKNNIISRGEKADINIDESLAVPVIMNAGDASLHHLFTLHKSVPNKTDKFRIGVVLRYLSTEVKPFSGKDCAMLVRGFDKYNHFINESRPKKNLHPDALKLHKEMMNLRDMNTGHNNTNSI